MEISNIVKVLMVEIVCYQTVQAKKTFVPAFQIGTKKMYILGH